MLWSALASPCGDPKRAGFRSRTGSHRVTRRLAGPVNRANGLQRGEPQMASMQEQIGKKRATRLSPIPPPLSSVTQ